MNQICRGLEADAWMIQEVGLCWDKVQDSRQWTERTQGQNDRLNLNLQYNQTELD